MSASPLSSIIETCLPGKEIVCGCPEVRAISNLPAGERVKLRLRHDALAQAVVKEVDGTVSRWLLRGDGNGGWEIWLKRGENRRPAVERRAAS